MSRRAVLVGAGVAVLAGGGGGVAAGLLRRVPGASRQPAPPDLVAALAAEQSLLASVRAAVVALPAGTNASVRTALAAIGNDHDAHRVALQAALAGYRPPETAHTVITGTAVPGGSPPSPAAAGPAAVRDAEKRAGADAAGRAARLTGRDATVLASIAACEATHGTWLSAVLA